MHCAAARYIPPSYFIDDEAEAPPAAPPTLPPETSALPAPPPAPANDTIAARRMPWLTFAILALLAAVFAAELAFTIEPAHGFLEPGARTLLALGGLQYVATVGSDEWYRMFLAPLMHTGLLHLLVNGIALYVAGRILEPAIGARWFAALFVVERPRRLDGIADDQRPHHRLCRCVRRDHGTVRGDAGAQLPLPRSDARTPAHHRDPGALRRDAADGVRELRHGRLSAPISAARSPAAPPPCCCLRCGRTARRPARPRSAVRGSRSSPCSSPSSASPARPMARPASLMTTSCRAMPRCCFPATGCRRPTRRRKPPPRGSSPTHPHDPRGHFYHALALIDAKNLSAAEAELRTALGDGELLQLMFKPAFSQRMEMLLSLVLLEQRKTDRCQARGSAGLRARQHLPRPGREIRPVQPVT